MNLAEELLWKSDGVRVSVHGRRVVSFAKAGELAHEQRLVDEAAQAAAAGRPSSRYLVMAALRDGRARFEGEIVELTALRWTTATDALRWLKKRGEVERIEVGPAVLWAATQAEELMIQTAIDFSALSRSTDPQTSHQAAGSVNGKALADMVLADLRQKGPGTTHEIAERMGLSLVTVSPRMKPLENAGKVIRCGKRDGRTVWVPKVMA